MTDFPITPPPELVQQWLENSPEDDELGIAGYIATQAARWGADQELNECCHLLQLQGFDVVDDLRAARRPKPPSLKEQALKTLQKLSASDYPCNYQGDDDWGTIRRALEQLDD